jgi:hypothetical protein
LEFYTRQFEGNHFRIYPLGDWHFGSRQCHTDFIAQVIAEIKADADGCWIGMGDFMENAIIGSKSDVYTQTVPPREQMDHIVDLLTPIKSKGLFMIGGNHEARTMRLVGIQPEAYIAARLDIPFVGFSCYSHLLTRADQSGTHRSHGRGFTVYAHHNTGGGVTAGGKINAAEKLRLIAPTADAIFSAHTHTTARTPFTWYETGKTSIIKKTGYDYSIGSALTWNGSYAEEKRCPPAAVEHIKVTFIGGTSGHADTRQQIYEIITPKGTA